MALRLGLVGCGEVSVHHVYTTSIRLIDALRTLRTYGLLGVESVTACDLRPGRHPTLPASPQSGWATGRAATVAWTPCWPTISFDWDDVAVRGCAPSRDGDRGVRGEHLAPGAPGGRGRAGRVEGSNSEGYGEGPAAFPEWCDQVPRLAHWCTAERLHWNSLYGARGSICLPAARSGGRQTPICSVSRASLAGDALTRLRPRYWSHRMPMRVATRSSASFAAGILSSGRCSIST